jgi:uncharacterized protein YegL
MNTINTTNHFTLRGLKRPSVITSETKQRVIFVRDVSLSMDDDNKSIDANAATQDLLTELALPENKSGFEVAVVDYSSNAKIIAPLTSACDLEGKLPDIKTDCSTNIAAGLETARNILQQAPNPVEGKEMYLKPVVILFSDGEHNSGNDPIVESNVLKQLADVITVAFGADADMDLLRVIANTPEHCYRCNEGRELRAFLAAVGETLSGSLQQGVNATQRLKTMTTTTSSTDY